MDLEKPAPTCFGGVCFLVMSSTGLLAGRLALVTGGSSGIGRAVCQAFAREGAKVIAADKNAAGAKETLLSCEGKQRDHLSAEVDVSQQKSVASLLQAVEHQYSRPPCIVVNCAGITKDNFILHLTEQDFEDVIRVNLMGTFLVTQAASQAMIRTNLRNGSIINFGSIVGKVGNLGQCNYAASKAGVEAFTKTVAKELAKNGIRCNVVLPGFIDTPMVSSVPEKVIDKLRSFIPMGRMGKPSEVADVCVFLASDKSSFITGTHIEVTGGLFT